jgi:hypothetical protein
MSNRFSEERHGPALAKCRRFGFDPIHAPMGDDHHTSAPLSEEDKEIGQAIAFFLGGLFIDVEGDPDYFYRKMTSNDAWGRVARALRIHGLKIVSRDDPRS